MSRERWIKQTKLTATAESPGDCFLACIASLLNIPLEDVPPFDMMMLKDIDACSAAVKRFLLAYGYNIVQIGGMHLPLEGYYMVKGETRHEGHFHYVIMKDGQPFHDPGGDQGGITKIIETYLLVPVDPAISL